MTQHIVAVANAIRAERYPDAAVMFAAGSIVRGEGTAFSDLDLVIVHGRLDRAYRESFRYDRVPVEAFVHDPETLGTFFKKSIGRAACRPWRTWCSRASRFPERTTCRGS